MNNYLTSANTTIMQILNNGSYLNSAWNSTNTSYMLVSQWNATNASYYLASNPLGFYNVTTLPAWNATNGSYMTGDNFTIQNQSMINQFLQTAYSN